MMEGYQLIRLDTSKVAHVPSWVVTGSADWTPACRFAYAADEDRWIWGHQEGFEIEGVRLCRFCRETIVRKIEWLGATLAEWALR